ncbi:MAG: hypothetical protein ACUVQG_03220 [Thermogutta sp.]
MIDSRIRTLFELALRRELPLIRTARGLVGVLVTVWIHTQLCLAPLASQWQGPPTLFSDYESAYRVAEGRQALLLVAFVKAEDEESVKNWLRSAMDEANLRTSLVPVVVSIGAVTELNGEKIVLSSHAAFSALNGQPGLAVVNLATNRSDSEFGRVIWTLVLKRQDWAKKGELVRLCLVELAASYYGPRKLPEASASLPEDSPDDSGQANTVVLATHLSPQETSIWLTDYEKAVARAKSEKKMLLVYLRPEQPDSQVSQFERRTLLDPQVMNGLLQYVCVRVPESYAVEENGSKVKLLDHPSLTEMAHCPGLFIVDYASTEAEYYGQVVSVFPFLDGRPYSVEQMDIILTLPPGSLTQRTMVYAVRVHPERPKSILGRPDPFLFKEAEKHSAYQARIRLLGHHFWETRFHRIIETLQNESTASEVCAESWPGQGLLQAALECVRCWRLSPGHWRSVSSNQDAYGYDIKKGSDGIWYATGIFANRR